MTANRCLLQLSILVLAFLVLPADAADRMRAGQWAGTTTFPGKTVASSQCITQADADAMNGDAKSIQAYLETIIPPTICKLTDFKIDGGQIIYTSTCGGGAANVTTATYHGDSFVSLDSKGTKSEGKLMGACK